MGGGVERGSGWVYPTLKLSCDSRRPHQHVSKHVLWKKQQRTSKLENQHSMQSKVAYNIIHRKFKPYQLLLSFMSPAMSL